MNRQSPIFALESFLPYRLARIAEHVSREFSTVYLERYGLSRAEWRCLATLGQFGAVTATDIAAHSAMHKTKVSRAIAGLDRRGWIIRAADNQDRRMEHLSLTDAGGGAYEDIVPLARNFERDLRVEIGGRAAHLLAGVDAVERHFGLPPFLERDK
jgi:DNA-binding MarR family transcriptional regulator